MAGPVHLLRLAGYAVLLGVVATLVAIGDPREFARDHGGRQRLSIATGGTGGVWYPYGGAIAHTISLHVPNVEATAEVTAASVDNLKLLHAGKVDIAFSVADVLGDAYHGREAFREVGRVPARAIAVLYPQYTHLVTVESSRIDAVEALRGKVVSLGPAGSGTLQIAERILAAIGIDPRTGIRPQFLSVAEAVNAIKDGKLDAFFWSGGVPTGAILDLASTPGRRMRLLPTASALPGLEESHGSGAYHVLPLPAAAYPGQPHDVAVIAVSAVLLVDEGMHEELAYDITRALFEHREELIAVHPVAKELDLVTAVTGSPVPFHPGAVRYYHEVGAWPTN
ncbi:MAG TPA: TAXI family TRAP transporter solute-binding subunit [Longimicrobiales bacterium]